MAITHAAGVRTSLATVIKDALEAGAGSAVLEIYDAGATTLLASVDLGATVGTVSGAVLTFSNLPASDNSINATGTAAEVQWKDSNGNLVYQGTITQSGGGGDVELGSADAAALNFVAGNVFTLSSGTYTAAV